MTPRKKRVLFYGAVVIGSLVLLTVMLPGEPELSIRCVDGGRTLLVLPLAADERFTLHYYHSVENTPIWEEHSIDRHGRIYIEEERYLRFGAGMGRVQGVGHLVRRGSFDAIEGMHMPTGDFTLRVGSPGVDHTIIWRGTRTNLSGLVPHQAVQFSARPRSLAYTLWHRIFPHASTPEPGESNA